MSEENVEATRRGFEHLQATGDFLEEIFDPEFVWDLSPIRGRFDLQKTYFGVEGARQFMRDWLEAWDDWELKLEAVRDAGDQVVAIVHQRGRAKATGLQVGMTLGQVFTYRDGKLIRMEMYPDPSAALEAAGLSE